MPKKIYKELQEKADGLVLSSRTKSDLFYKKYILTTNDEISLVLKSHLYLERVIDEILSLTLPQSKKIIKMSFLDKLAILESMDAFTTNKVVPEKIKALNTIRNKFSHELDYTLNRDDLNKLFKIKKGNKDSNMGIFLREIGYLHGYFDFMIHFNILFPFLANSMRNKTLYKEDKKFNIGKIVTSYNKDGLLDIIKEMKK